MLRAFLELIRLPAVFSAPADVLGATAFAMAVGASPSLLNVITLSAVSLLLYMGGMITNDLFDIQVDTQERPGRPLPSGRVRMSAAWSLALAMQAVAFMLASQVSMVSLSCAVGVCALTYLYNGVTKSSMLGPLVMGLCRGANLYLGLSLLSDFGWSHHAWLMGGIIVVYVMCITWVSRYEVGPSTQKGQIAARVLRISGGLPFLAMPLAVTSRSVSLALLSVLLIWLNLRFYPFGFRPISKGLKREVVQGLGGILVLYASLSCVFTQFSIAAVLLGCLFCGKLAARWFYAT